MATVRPHRDRFPDTGDLLTVGGLAIGIVSVGVSAVSYSALPSRIQTRWTIGGPHYGSEFAPTLLVLVTFPLVIGSLAVAGCWLRRYLERTEEFDAVQPAYDALVLSGLALLVLAQVLITVANLG